MSETGCGFQRAEDRHAPEWFCVVHQCWSSTPDLCPLQRAEAAIKRVREVIEEGQKDRGWGHDDDFDAGWDRCANDILRAVEGALEDNDY